MKRLFYRTKRPWWVRIFRTIGYFLLFFLSPLCFIVGDILSRVVFADTAALEYFSLILFVLSVTLSLPFAYLLLIQKLKKRLITILHFGLQALIIGGLLFADSISLHFSGQSKYLYRFGNCSTALGGVLRSNWGQSLYGVVIDQFPLTTQYAVSTIEDTCRINMIKTELNNDLAGVCGDTDADLCVGELLQKVASRTAFSAGGIVLGTRYRLLLIGHMAKDLQKQNGELRIEDHLMLSGRLVAASLEGMALLMDRRHLSIVAGEDRLRKFSGLSDEEKAYYEIVVRNQFLTSDSAGFGQALSLVFGRTLLGLPDDVDRFIAEYVLISIMDGKLRSDSITHTRTYVEEVISKSLVELEKVDNADQRLQIKAMFDSFREKLNQLHFP